jgi:protein TonB
MGPPGFAQRYNTIPVRVIIDAEGKVRHIHLLSAFPDQSQAILTALREWRFKPYMVDGKAVEVETGMVFGMPRLVGR